jgi:hypothetical protein
MTVPALARAVRSIRQTPAVVAGTIRRRDGLAVAAFSTVGYLALYSVAIGDLSLRRGADIGLVAVDRPLVRLLEQAPGAFSFEPILLVQFGLGTYLFSPINAALGLLIALLVGLNMALSRVAIAQPRSCGIGAGSGLFASIPALLAGGACCAPVVFIALGITASGTLLALVPWLLPLGLLLLAASAIYLAGQIDPAVLAAGASQDVSRPT